MKRLLAGHGGTHVGADGIPRKPSVEAEIVRVFETIAALPEGGAMLNYLRSITADAVLMATASDAELRHMEGMRALYAIIKERMSPRNEGSL